LKLGQVCRDFRNREGKHQLDEYKPMLIASFFGDLNY